MDGGAFTALVRDLVGAMGQRLEAARPIDEGLALRTADHYLYVFIEDVSRVEPSAARRWCEEGQVAPDHLVIFALESLPTTWGPEVLARGGAVVAGRELARLADELGIDSPLLAKDPAFHRPSGSTLPSARELDADMLRAETWDAAGIPSLSARFYAEAAHLKPEFVPAWAGLARAQGALRDWDAAEQSWRRVLEVEPGSLEAQLGLAAIAGERGDPEGEIAAYRSIIRERPTQTPPRAALVAAYIERGAWDSAREEIETLVHLVPTDARLHYLYAEALERTGAASTVVARERAAARDLGLTDVESAELRRAYEPVAPVSDPGDG